jgi:hypothetical protein
MNKKILALIILLVAIFIGYGLLYAGVNAVLMPQDLNEYQSQLNNMPEIPVVNNSTIDELESSADLMDNSSPLKYMSPSERTAMADFMRTNNSVPPEISNQNFTVYINYIDNRAFPYILVFRGDIYDEIENISVTYDKIASFSNKSQAISQKMADDFENGDDKAYAQDLRDLATLLKDYNSEMASLKSQLQEVVNQLGG